MIQENEILRLLLGVSVLAFFVVGHTRIKELPGWRVLLSAFVVLLVGWILTVLEGFFWPDVLNLLEHTCHASSTILLAVWCWRFFVGREAATE